MRLKLLCPLVALVISACTFPVAPQLIEPGPTPVITPVVPVDNLSTQNVSELREIITLTSTSREPIAALVFTNSAQELMAVHAPSGLLVHWDQADGQQLSTLDLGPVGVGAASFDGEGRWVVTAAGATPEALDAGLGFEFNGYRLYDAVDGSLLQESFPYDLPKVPIYDVALSIDGKLIVYVTDGGISVQDRAAGEPQISFSYIISSDFNHDLRRYIVEQNATTFDAVGEWVALMDDSGSVRLWRLANLDDQYGVGMGTGPYETVLALAIDTKRRYIATVTTKNLVMRQIRLSFLNIFDAPGLIDEKVAPGPAAGLVFSPDGTLLAASTKSDWQLWSVPEYRRLLLENTGAYAVAFSPDGRLLAIGGTDGVIHVWACRYNKTYTLKMSYLRKTFSNAKG